MRVLLTNDDGYLAPGLRALAEAVSALGLQGAIVAPSAQMSGASRSRRGGPAAWARAEPVAGIPVIHVAGTPAACVLFALTSGVLPRFDLCLSGINAGENLGAALTVSGTYGAVLEAASYGVPGVALSREFGGPWNEPLTWDWSWVAGAARRTLETLLAERDGWFTANVNLSGTDRGADPARTRVSRTHYYTDRYDLARAGIVSTIGYPAAVLDPDDDIRAFGEEKRTSVTLFPRA